MIGDISLYTSRFSQFLKRGESRVRAGAATVEKFPGVEGPGLTVPGGGSGGGPEQIAALLEEVEACALELRREGAAAAHVEELEELRRSVRAFIAEQGPALSAAAPSPKELIEALRAAAVPAPLPAAAPANTLFLAGELDEARAEALRLRLGTVAAKLDALELLIGSTAPFQSKSVCVAVQEELRSTAYLDPSAAADVLRRLELVAEEVARQASDRRMNYFSQQQRQEMTQFFAEFREAQEEFAAGSDANPVTAAVDALEANQPLLQRAARFFEQGQDMSEALEALQREAEENRAALATMQEQMALNCQVLEDNLRLLKA